MRLQDHPLDFDRLVVRFAAWFEIRPDFPAGLRTAGLSLAALGVFSARLGISFLDGRGVLANRNLPYRCTQGITRALVRTKVSTTLIIRRVAQLSNALIRAI
jgi:hypothetical protein